MKKRWYLVKEEDEYCEKIVHDISNNVKTITFGGKYNIVSPGYETKEELIKCQKISGIKCVKCGGERSLAYNNIEELKKYEMCFSCNHWREIRDSLNDKKNVIIDGSSYYIDPPKQNGGYGGREFKIKRFDSDEVVVTNNLWCKGDVPEVYKNQIPNNAKFVK